MTKICQISDIHWRGITRHEEYTNIFNDLFTKLKEEIKPDYIIGTGDF
jgi:predicted MPP superfamily phosphohydrolase